MTRRQNVTSSVLDELIAEDLDQVAPEEIPVEIREREWVVDWMLYEHRRDEEMRIEEERWQRKNMAC